VYEYNILFIAIHFKNILCSNYGHGLILWIIELIWAGHVARMGETRNEYRILVGKPEGKRPLGLPRRRLVDNIKMDLEETG
jgi:hypothetical protein